jgi:hypothetical protein
MPAIKFMNISTRPSLNYAFSVFIKFMRASFVRSTLYSCYLSYKFPSALYIRDVKNEIRGHKLDADSNYFNKITICGANYVII